MPTLTSQRKKIVASSFYVNKYALLEKLLSIYRKISFTSLTHSNIITYIFFFSIITVFLMLNVSYGIKT